jgi:hypothetical protein
MKMEKNRIATEHRPVADCCGHGDETLGSVKSRGCHYQLSDNYRVKENTGLSNYYNQITLQNCFLDEGHSMKMHCTHCLEAQKITGVERCRVS